MYNPANTIAFARPVRRLAHIAALLLAMFFVTTLVTTTVQAASSLTIVADRAKIVRIAGEISSVIVGNPAFADVSVQKKFLIVHGRNFGQTNILILDENGDTLADLNVTVIKGPDRNISVYRGGAKASYACAPKCESTLQVGDAKAYFEGVNQAIATKMELARSAGKLTTK